MKISLSRRSLLIGLGGGLAATSLVWSLGGFDLWSADQQGSVAAAGTSYVDHDGWMLTAEDKSRLLATATFRRLEHTNLAGSDIASRVVTDLDACALWCVTEPTCRSFAFVQSASVRGRAGTCWIKNAVPEAAPLEGYTSGIRE